MVRQQMLYGICCTKKSFKIVYAAGVGVGVGGGMTQKEKKKRKTKLSLSEIKI